MFQFLGAMASSSRAPEYWRFLLSEISDQYAATRGEASHGHSAEYGGEVVASSEICSSVPKVELVVQHVSQPYLSGARGIHTVDLKQLSWDKWENFYVDIGCALRIVQTNPEYVRG
jgi:hypothetical protein